MGPQQGLNLGWGDDLEASRFGLWISVKPKISIPRRREFLPVGSAGGRSPPSLAIDGIAREEPAGTPPMPRITLRFAGKQRFFSRTIKPRSGDPTQLCHTGAVGALHERDPGLAKLGGEPTRALALRAMRASAAALFAHPVEPSSWETRKLNQWQAHLGAEMRSSHIQLVATPITIVYQV